jgi:hypothetical protein
MALGHARVDDRERELEPSEVNDHLNQAERGLITGRSDSSDRLHEALAHERRIRRDLRMAGFL